nr:transposase [Fischerella sp. PCC 9605]
MHPISTYALIFTAVFGVDFTTIDGLDVLTVQTIVSEVGLDPKRFKSAKNFVCWLGLCPGSRISGGKILSSKTRKVVNRAESCVSGCCPFFNSFPICHWCFLSSQKSSTWCSIALLLALPIKSARLFYHLWSTGEVYQAPGADCYEHKHKQRIINNLKKTAQKLGCDLIVNPTAQEDS